MSDRQPFILNGTTGQPFTTREEAVEERKRRELPGDKFSVVQVPNGWAIQDNGAAAMALMLAQQPKPEGEPRRYWEIECGQTGNPNDPPYVPAIVNGWELRIQRGKKVIIPESHYLVLKNAFHTKWAKSNDPREPVKADGIIQRYPFRVLRGPKGTNAKLGEQPDGATEEEFRKQLDEGNAITNEFLARLRKAGP